MNIPFLRYTTARLAIWSAFDRLAVFANDMKRNLTVYDMLLQLLQGIELMKPAILIQLSKAQQRDKRDYEKNVWQELAFKSREFHFRRSSPTRRCCVRWSRWTSGSPIQYFAKTNVWTVQITQRSAVYSNTRGRHTKTPFRSMVLGCCQHKHRWPMNNTTVDSNRTQLRTKMKRQQMKQLYWRSTW